MRDVQADHIIEWFLELEERLLSLMRHVPFNPETENVSLPRASGIILEACSLVDTVFRETMVSDKSRDKLSMKDFEPYFEGKLALSGLRSILFLWPPKYLVPFAAWSGSGARSRLAWWNAYTDIKHSRVASLKHATLGNAIQATAALHQVMSQTSFFWVPFLRRDMLGSSRLLLANFVNNMLSGAGLSPASVAIGTTATVESQLFCTTLGSERFPEHESDLRQSRIAKTGSKRLQRFLGLN